MNYEAAYVMQTMIKSFLDRDACRAVAAGFVKGVGDALDHGGGGVVVLDRGEAEAHRGFEAMLGERARGKFVAVASDDGLGTFDLGVREIHDELVASEPAEDVDAADAEFEGVREFAQKFDAGVRSTRFDDRLEIVDIHDDE